MGIPGAIKEVKSGYCFGSVKAGNVASQYEIPNIKNVKDELLYYKTVLQNCRYWPVKAGFIARDKFSNFPKKKDSFLLEE